MYAYYNWILWLVRYDRFIRPLRQMKAVRRPLDSPTTAHPEPKSDVQFIAARQLIASKLEEDQQRLQEAKIKFDLHSREAHVRLYVQVVLTIAITGCCLVLIVNPATPKEHLGIASAVLGAAVAYWFKPSQ